MNEKSIKKQVEINTKNLHALNCTLRALIDDLCERGVVDRKELERVAQDLSIGMPGFMIKGDKTTKIPWGEEE